MTSELKSCPFCGSTAHITEFHQDGYTYTVFCDMCGASVGVAEANEKEAVEAWNLRAPLQRWTKGGTQ